MILPLVDDFKLDAFGLDDPFESSVITADVEFELLFKLWAARVLDCARFVPLGLLLHTNTTRSLVKAHAHTVHNE